MLEHSIATHGSMDVVQDHLLCATLISLTEKVRFRFAMSCHPEACWPLKWLAMPHDTREQTGNMQTLRGLGQEKGGPHAMSLPTSKWPEHGARTNFELLNLVAGSIMFTEKVTSLNEMAAFAAIQVGVTQSQEAERQGTQVGQESVAERTQ